MRERSSHSTAPITVILLPLGGERKEVVLETDATVEEALAAGGYEKSDRTEVRVNGEKVDDFKNIVEDGDKLVITSAGKIEGVC